VPVTATVAVLAMVAALRLVVFPTANSAVEPAAVVVADSDGGLSVTLDGLPYRLEAVAGTLPPDSRLEVGAAEGLRDLGVGRLLLPAVSLRSSVQPVRPVRVETTEPLDLPDVTAATAAVWDPAVRLPEALSIEQLEDGRVRALVPHFSAFGLFGFPSQADLIPWQIKGAVGYLENFFNLPFDCSSPTYSSTLLTPDGHPSSVHLQVDAVDKDVGAGTVSLPVCNRLRTVMTYVGSGAGSATGFALPRSEVPLDVHLQGTAGDRFTLTARFDRDAAIATVVLLLIDAMPSGQALTTRLIQNGLVNSGSLTLIVDIGRSCGSAIDAALATPGARSWDAALSCLRNLGAFTDAIAQLAYETAVEIGLDEALEAVPQRFSVHLDLILGGQVFNRVLAEWIWFDGPRELAFPFRLWCGDPAACPFRTPAPPADEHTPIPGPESGSGSGEDLPPSPSPDTPTDSGPCPNGMEGPGPGPDGTSGCYVPGFGPEPGAPGPTGPTAPQVVSVSTYTEGVLVYVSLAFSDPEADAVGFGFRGVNGLWAEEKQAFATTSYGRASPGRIDYPFNHACGTPSQIESDVEAWIYDSTGLQSESVIVHLACS
jgi:hypothetical protein